MDTSPLTRKSALLPIIMSLAALALVLGYVARFGAVQQAEQADEGTAARIFQLLIVAQLPLIVYFALTSLPKQPRQALLVLGLQCCAALVAVGTVVWLEST